MKKIISMFVLIGILCGCNTMKSAVHRLNLLLDDDGSYAAQLELENQKRIFEDECRKKGGDVPVSSISYDEFLTMLKPQLESPTMQIANPSKNNMILNALVVKALESVEKQIEAFLSCYAAINYSFRRENCYINLESRKKSYEKLRQDIVQYSYDYEKAKFKKITGYIFANVALAFTDSPEQGKLYSLEGSKVLQNITGGMLLSGGRYGEKVNFVYTTNALADGASVSGYADYVGLFSYVATLGNKKTVNAYRVLPKGKYKKTLDSCLFYSENSLCDSVYGYYGCEYVLKREPTPAEIKSLLKKK